MARIARSKTYIRHLPSSSADGCLVCGAPLGSRQRFYCSTACRKKGSSLRRAEERQIRAPLKDFTMSDPWAEGRLGEEITRGALLDGWAGTTSHFADGV